jgi:hypothetical protein
MGKWGDSTKLTKARFGPKADLLSCPSHFRFTLKADILRRSRRVRLNIKLMGGWYLSLTGGTSKFERKRISSQLLASISARKFPVTAKDFPDTRNVFPVNLHRELLEKHCGTATSCAETVLKCPKSGEYPVKFPVSREFARRQMRSALRRQPSTLAPLGLSRRRSERPANGGLSRSLRSQTQGTALLMHHMRG